MLIKMTETICSYVENRKQFWKSGVILSQESERVSAALIASGVQLNWEEKASPWQGFSGRAEG